MSTSKRIISLLLALVMVLGMLPWDALGVEAAGTGEIIHVVEEPVKLIQTEEPVANSDGIAVTRAQWLQMLVEVFDYHIEDEIVPDNYFTDLHEEAEYYEDILVAVYYGLVDVLPNSPMEPEAAATREFAVSTLNSCMGYLPEGEPDFAEAAEVTYPDDIQVALEQGWFALTNGAFLPEQPITAEELALLQAAAEAYVEDFTIVPTESQYTFKEGVIEVTEEADISTVDGIDIVTVANLSKAIAPGDKFVVYSGGLAIPYLAETVTKDGASTIITTTELVFEDAVDTMLVQQETDADPANFYAAEDAELIFIEEESGTEYSQQAVMDQMASGSTKVFIPKFSKKINLGDNTSFTLSVELKKTKVCYDVDIGLIKGSAAAWLDTNVEVSGKISCDLSKFSNADIEVYIGGYEIPGVGGLSIYVKADATGSFSVVKKYHMLAGIRVAYDVLKLKSTKSYLFELNDKGSTVNAEIAAKIYLEAELGFNGKALPLKGYLFAEGGFKTKMKRTTYSEFEGNCTHFTSHLYAEYGAKIEWKILGFKDKLEWSLDLIDEKNSPVKLSFHYEDGKYVAKCTRKNLSGTSTGDSGAIGDSGYVTGSGSKYTGSGLSSGGNSTGYGSDGEPVVIYTYTLDEKNNATITSYKGNATSLTIPLMLDGYNVTAIGANAFKNKTCLRTVIMQDNIQMVGESAFYGCSNLRNLTLSDSLTSIGSSVFRNCTSLTTVDIPGTITSIGIYAFSGCTNLMTVSMPDSVSVIGSRAFYNCTNLTTINYPHSWTRVIEYDKNALLQPTYDGPFAGCTRLSEITIPDGVTSVPAYAFYNCTGLKKVRLPESITSIQSYAFAGCVNIVDVYIPDSVSSIAGRAFYNCTNLESINIPRSWVYVDRYYYNSYYVRSYYDGPFAGCSRLSTIVIPDGMVAIPKYAFQNCTGLKTIQLPESVEVINSDAFSGCINLQTINIPIMLAKIDYDAFYACSSLKTLNLPNGLTVIGENAFRESGIISIEIPHTVTSIGTACFRACANLDTVIWTNSVTTIPEDTFYDCTSLSQLTLPDSVKVINSSAFCNCDALVAINLPASLTTIKSYAFIGCDALESLTIPDKVTTIEQQAFDNCSALRTVKFPNSLRTINTCAFYDCDSLTEVLIPYGVTTIESKAFYDCDALEKVELANSVTSLGSYIFYHCDLLKDVSLSRNLKAIPASAFQDCPVMEEIVIPYFTTSIGDNAFNSNVALTRIVTHENLTSISTSAFSYADWNVFYGHAGSYTESWCADNGYTFVENTVVAAKVTPAETSVSIPKGKTYMLDFDIDPIDFHEVITTKSSNTAVATVDETGKITAVAPGTATIKIIVGGASASCKVTVTQAVTKITLNKTKLSLDVPQTYQLTATITPSDASNKTLNWTSSNPAAATVDANGLVTAVGNGTAVIKAESTDGTGISASCTVTVVDPSKIPVSGIALDKNTLSLEAMEDYQLTATVSPTNAANKGLVWSSSNEAVATVDSDGKVTAVAKGTVTITAAAADGYGASASCTVTVTNNGYLVTDLAQFQSSHPYADRCTDFWLYRRSGAGSLSITFAAETEIEDGFDYLYIYDGEGNLIGKYTGTELAGQTITIPGSTVKVQIESDDSGNAWGFRVTNIGGTDHTHSFTNYVSDGNATCTEDGTKTAKCDHCGLTDTIPDTGSALGHSFGNWNVIQHPTVSEEGLEERTCARCGYTEQRSIASLENPFTDVPAGSFFYDPVMWAVENGITSGTSATTFGPGDQCMRAHVVTFLWKAVGSPEPTKTSNPFVDVKPTDFFYKPVLWALENGITSGVDATHFGPASYCNRAQVITFLYQTKNRPAVDSTRNPFTDVPNGQWFTTPVLWAVENGITSGLSATSFGPGVVCNRAQIVTFLYKAFVNK